MTLFPCFLAVLLQGQVPEAVSAEGMFRSMEEKLLRAKSVQCELEFRLSGLDVGRPVNQVGKGSLLLAQGNKFRTTEHFVGEDGMPLIHFASDGKKFACWLEGKKDSAKWLSVHKRLNEIVTIALCREGLAPGVFHYPPFALTGDKAAKEEADISPKARIQLSAFKLGAKEKVLSKDAQAIHYEVRRKDMEREPGFIRQPILQTVWLDAKTGLPVKRKTIYFFPDVTKLTEGKGKIDIDQLPSTEQVVTETYRDWKLDEAIDDARFALPKFLE